MIITELLFRFTIEKTKDERNNNKKKYCKNYIHKRERKIKKQINNTTCWQQVNFDRLYLPFPIFTQTFPEK